MFYCCHGHIGKTCYTIRYGLFFLGCDSCLWAAVDFLRCERSIYEFTTVLTYMNGWFIRAFSIVSFNLMIGSILTATTALNVAGQQLGASLVPASDKRPQSNKYHWLIHCVSSTNQNQWNTSKHMSQYIIIHQIHHNLISVSLQRGLFSKLKN